MGYNSYSIISKCYSTGSVSGTDYLGGLVGYNDCYIETISNCYFLDIAGPDNRYGTPLTDAQMRQQSSFVGLDFVGESANGTHQFWQMPADGGYPVLSIFHGYVPPILEGDGTSDNPYLIRDPNELGAICYYDNSACYRLVDDINLAGITWSMAVIPFFSGCFDGNDHAISNLNIDTGGAGINYLGLFGQIGSGGEVRNLVLENVSINGGNGLISGGDTPIRGCYLGSLVGYNDSGTIASMVIAAVQTARRLTPDFEVLVVNDGSADALGAVLTDTLPAGLTPTGVVTWPLGTVLAGEHGQVVLAATVQVTGAASHLFENRATIGTATPEEDEENNDASAQNELVQRADLEIDKQVEPPVVEPGELHMPRPVEVQIGGAVVFVLEVERFERF